MPLESGSTFQLDTRTSFKIQFLFLQRGNELIHYSPHYHPTTNYFYQFRANHLWNYRKSDIERTLLIAKKRARKKVWDIDTVSSGDWVGIGQVIEYGPWQWTSTPQGDLPKQIIITSSFFGGNENSRHPRVRIMKSKASF